MTRCTCTVEMERAERREGRKVLCPYCCEPARADLIAGRNVEGWVETLLDTIAWQAEKLRTPCLVRLRWVRLSGSIEDSLCAVVDGRVVEIPLVVRHPRMTSFEFPWILARYAVRLGSSWSK